jgi:hypothetical protein
MRQNETETAANLTHLALFCIKKRIKKSQVIEKFLTQDETAANLTHLALFFKKKSQVIEKFLTQDETAANLTHLTKEAQSRIEALNEEKGLAKAKVEEMRYSGPGTFGSRRIVGES